MNPVLLSVVALCVLCLLKLNVLMSLIIAALVGAVTAGIGIPEAMDILCGGFGANAGTALSYIFLGTFASAVADTGLADIMSKKLSRMFGSSRVVLLLMLFPGIFIMLSAYSFNLVGDGLRDALDPRLRT